MTSALLYASYNRTPLLRNSLTRLAEKTMPDEVIVVDDGSDDGCKEMCAEFPFVRYIYTHNPGQQMRSHATNVGLLATDADIFLHADPEILFETDVVKELLTVHKERPKEFITAGTFYVQDNTGAHAKTLKGWAPPYAAIYKRQWLLDVGGWDEGFPIPWGYEDIDIAARLSAKLGVEQYIDERIIVTHQWHEPAWFHSEGEVDLNSDYFMAKGFHWENHKLVPDKPGEGDLVANLNNPNWGVPRV